MNTPTEILRALVADLDAMRCSPPDEMIDCPDPNACFGPFNTGVLLSTSETVICWPNLAPLLDQANKVLETEGAPPCDPRLSAAEAAASELAYLAQEVGERLTDDEAEIFADFLRAWGWEESADTLLQAQASAL